jgi:endonuclease/exonuclease/phosphatase family metal-dependent hydrolase
VLISGIRGGVALNLRVATFNIRHGLGADGELDLKRTARVIRDLDADVVALQEVDRGWARSGSEDQGVRLQELTGMAVTFLAAFHKPDGAAYGIAVATKERGAVVGSLPLPRKLSEEPRTAAVLELGSARILCTHLTRDPAARPAQIDALAAAVRSAPGPVIVAGDLNTAIRNLRPLLEAGLERGPRPKRTVPARFPRAAIDHILGGKGATVLSLRAVRSWASDHRPLVAEVAL